MKTFAELNRGHYIYFLRWPDYNLPEVIVYKIEEIKKAGDQAYQVTHFIVKLIRGASPGIGRNTTVSITKDELSKSVTGWFFTDPMCAVDIIRKHIKFLTNARKVLDKNKPAIMSCKLLMELSNIIYNARKAKKIIYEEAART